MINTILQPSTSTLHNHLSIDFIVIGGGLTGLTTAYALARGGHRVTVLEKDNFDNSNDGEGCRMPPNMSKVFFRWGFEERLRQIGLKSVTSRFSRFESDEYMGAHVWAKDYLDETGGDFLFARCADLRDFAYEIAKEEGVSIRPNAEVTSIDTETTSVNLVSGERLSADVIIGADGASGISRSTLLGSRPDKARSMGLIVYECLIPSEDVREDPGLSNLYDNACLDIMIGNMHGAIAIPIGRTKEIALHIYSPDRGLKSEPTLAEFREAADPIQGRLRKCLDSATLLTRKLVEDRPGLEHWIHDTCPFLVVGNAAHSMPAAALQNASVGTEDAATLGKLFSHLSKYDQIRSFLFAFQDLREPRVAKMKAREVSNAYLLTIKDGDFQRIRDAGMKANTAAGFNIFGGTDFSSEIWDENRVTFDFDAEECADNWWVEWGLLRERSRALLTLQDRTRAA